MSPSSSLSDSESSKRVQRLADLANALVQKIVIALGYAEELDAILGLYRSPLTPEVCGDLFDECKSRLSSRLFVSVESTRPPRRGLRSFFTARTCIMTGWYARMKFSVRSNFETLRSGYLGSPYECILRPIFLSPSKLQHIRVAVHDAAKTASRHKYWRT